VLELVRKCSKFYRLSYKVLTVLLRGQGCNSLTCNRDSYEIFLETWYNILCSVLDKETAISKHVQVKT